MRRKDSRTGGRAAIPLRHGHGVIERPALNWATGLPMVPLPATSRESCWVAGVGAMVGAEAMAGVAVRLQAEGVWAPAPRRLCGQTFRR